MPSYVGVMKKEVKLTSTQESNEGGRECSWSSGHITTLLVTL